MQVLTIILLSLVVLQGCSVGSLIQNEGYVAKAEPIQALPYYEAVNALLSDVPPTEIDFYEMRISYTYTRRYSFTSQNVLGLQKELRTALETQDYGQCIKLATEYLEWNYTSIMAHNFLRICLLQKGEYKQSNKHRDVVKALIFSFFSSGDGLSNATAIEVISSSELVGFMHTMTWDMKKIELVEPQKQVFSLEFIDRGSANKEVQNLWIKAPEQLIKRAEIVHE